MAPLSRRERVVYAVLGSAAVGTSFLTPLVHPAEILYHPFELFIQTSDLVLGLNCLMSSVTGRTMYLGIPTVYRSLKTVATKSYSSLKSVAKKSNDILKVIPGKIKRQRSESIGQSYPNAFYGLPSYTEL